MQQGSLVLGHLSFPQLLAWSLLVFSFEMEQLLTDTFLSGTIGLYNFGSKLFVQWARLAGHFIGSA
jgi:hypothetical protein